MTTIINKKNLKESKLIISTRLKKNAKQVSIGKHFGKLKRGLDGLQYQLKIRENED